MADERIYSNLEVLQVHVTMRSQLFVDDTPRHRLLDDIVIVWNVDLGHWVKEVIPVIGTVVEYYRAV